ncbi:MAG: hypothetical protein U0K57_06915 [Lachnospiraceae bacterium]|nr:hypothetical protein [Lachnospiraceae bacterium]
MKNKYVLLYVILLIGIVALYIVSAMRGYHVSVVPAAIVILICLGRLVWDIFHRKDE